MQGQNEVGRSAIGGTSQLGTDRQNIHYGVMPEQVTKTLQGGNVGEFIVIQQTRQGEQPTVWSSGDPEQTSHLFNHATQLFPQDAGAQRETVTT